MDDGGTPAPAPTPDGLDRRETARTALTALFVTALAVSQVTAAKLLGFDLPVALPVTGDAIVLPGAALAYAVTFFASDCYAELFGRRAAQRLVNVAFFMNVVVVALVWSTLAAPTATDSPVSGAEFAAVLGPSAAIVVGSMVAYLVSQNWDVLAFHWVRDRTGGDHLWLRNLASTASSQLLDTVIFVAVAFVVLQGLPLETALALIVGQYVFKLGVAVADTPFVYAVVGLVRAGDPATETAEGAVGE